MPVLLIQTHYLHSNALFASVQPYEVATVLGSCVSVCLWDKHLQIGGINHYMLPLWNGDGLASPKYGNIANQKLLEKMIALGSSPTSLVAKVFGGAKQFQQSGSSFNIGERNIQIALDMLREQHIPVSSKHVGGEQGRKLKFYTATGEVWLKLL